MTPIFLYRTIMTKGPDARRLEANLLQKWARTHRTWLGPKPVERPTMSRGIKTMHYIESDADCHTTPKRSRNCFQKIDVIDHWRQEFFYWDKRVSELRAKTSKKAGAIGFVTFRSAEHAHIVAQVQTNSRIRVNRNLSVEPRAIYWPNISLSTGRTYVRRFLSWIITILMMIFWVVPVVFVSTLLNLTFWEKDNPGLQKFAESHRIIRGFLTYTMPGIALLLFLNILPWMLKWLAIFGGCRTRQSIDYTVLTRHFAFLIINVILIFTVSGSIINKIFDILNSPTSLTKDLANSLPSVASWFVGYVLLLGVGCQPFKLILLRPAIWHAFKAWFCKTPRDHASIVAPIYLDWGNVYPYPMMVFWIAMIYSSFSPLILPVTAAYYALGFFVLKYQMLYVYFRDFESAGLLWPRILLRLALGILVYQVIMFCYLLETKRPYYSAAIAPLILHSAGYLWYRVRKVRSMGEFVPLQLYRDADAAAYQQAKGEKSAVVPIQTDMYIKPKSTRPRYRSSSVKSSFAEFQLQPSPSPPPPREPYFSITFDCSSNSANRAI